MRRFALLLAVAVGPMLAGCGKHLSENEKSEWIEYWSARCRCQTSVEKTACEMRLNRPQAKGTFASYAAADREIIENGGIRCERGLPR